MPLNTLLFDPMIARYIEALPSGVAITDVSARPPTELELAEANALVTPRLDSDVLEACPNLGFIQIPGAGTDGIPFEDLPMHLVVATTGHHGRSIAEYVVMSMILIGRRFISADRALRDGVWLGPQRMNVNTAVPDTLRGQTVVILGMGEIGEEVARLALAFDMEVIGVRRSVTDPIAGLHDSVQMIGVSDLDQVLPDCDHLVLATPLTEETRGLIGGRRLELLRPSATLINVSRGPIVDPNALFEAVQSGSIAGAALDVWYRYPAGPDRTQPADQPFASLDQVLMTPHSSAVTGETFRARALDVTRNLQRYAHGERLRNIVWPIDDT